MRRGQGAIDRAELGHLTGMLGKLETSVAAAAEATDGERASSNQALVDAAVRENVRQTVATSWSAAMWSGTWSTPALCSSWAASTT